MKNEIEIKNAIEEMTGWIKSNIKDSEENLKVFLNELEMSEEEVMNAKNTISYAAYEIASKDIYTEMLRELFKIINE